MNIIARAKRNAGTTLIEAMVYTALLGVVLTCIYWVLIASMRYYNIADSSVELQQNAMNAMSTMTRELSESVAATIYDQDTSSPKGIIFASPRNRKTTDDLGGTYIYDSSRNLLWSKWICYYIDTSMSGGARLVRKEYYKSAANTGDIDPAVSCDHDTTADFQSDTALAKRVLGKYITNLSLTLNGDVLTIVADFEKSPSIDKRNTIQVRSEVKLRNK